MTAHKNYELLRKACILAQQVLIDDGKEPTPSLIVWRMIEEAYETLKRLPNKEMGWLHSLRTLWPEIRGDYADQIENYRNMLERIKNGEEDPDALFLGKKPSPAAVARMDAIFDEIPKLLVGSNLRRDWQILSCLARGLEAPVTARIAECSRRTVFNRKELQLGRLASALAERLPGVFEALPKAVILPPPSNLAGCTGCAV